jgi:hypothetical protein
MMVKKAIAAMLLVTMAAWAEMALAPMLAMHAGHMRPGHEMAADMPHGTHHHAAQHAEPAQMDSHRPCCPGLHEAEPAIVLEIASTAPGCDDPHSCCFRQGPQSVPAPVSDVQKMAREMAPATVVEITPVRPAANGAIPDRVLAVSPPPDVFGMTLRV